MTCQILLALRQQELSPKWDQIKIQDFSVCFSWKVFFSVFYMKLATLIFELQKKKQGQIWNQLKNIIKRTEPVFWFLIQFAWKKLLKIGYFADIPVFPGVKNIFPCIKKLKQNLKKRLCMSNYMLLRIPKYSLFLFLVENKGIDNFELHKVPK